MDIVSGKFTLDTDAVNDFVFLRIGVETILAMCEMRRGIFIFIYMIIMRTSFDQNIVVVSVLTSVNTIRSVMVISGSFIAAGNNGCLIIQRKTIGRACFIFGISDRHRFAACCYKDSGVVFDGNAAACAVFAAADTCCFITAIGIDISFFYDKCS